MSEEDFDIERCVEAVSNLGKSTVNVRKAFQCLTSALEKMKEDSEKIKQEDYGIYEY